MNGSEEAGGNIIMNGSEEAGGNIIMNGSEQAKGGESYKRGREAAK